MENIYNIIGWMGVEADGGRIRQRDGREPGWKREGCDRRAGGRGQ